MAQGKNLVQILWDAGFRGKGLRTAYGIVMRESGGRADAYNPNRSTGDDSYGLFQINMLGNMGASRRKQFGLRSNEDLLDPLTNAKAAFRMSNGGKDFGAWGIGPNAYRSGAGYDTIKQYVDQFPGVPGGGWGKAPRTSAAQKAAAPDLQTSVPQLTAKSKDFLSQLQKRRSVLAEVMQRNSEALGLTPPKALINRLLTITPEDEARAAKFGGTVRPPTNPKTGDIPGVGSDAANPKIKAALEIAHSQIGQPYVWGAESPSEGGFDCSGLIDYAFKQAGIKIPGRLTTYSARKLGKRVSIMNIQPGDWVITNGGKHMVMYVGGGKVIAAPHKGEVVQYQPLSRFKDIVDIRRFW